MHSPSPSPCFASPASRSPYRSANEIQAHQGSDACLTPSLSYLSNSPAAGTNIVDYETLPSQSFIAQEVAHALRYENNQNQEVLLDLSAINPALHTLGDQSLNWAPPDLQNNGLMTGSPQGRSSTHNTALVEGSFVPDFAIPDGNAQGWYTQANDFWSPQTFQRQQPYVSAAIQNNIDIPNMSPMPAQMAQMPLNAGFTDMLPMQMSMAQMQPSMDPNGLMFPPAMDNVMTPPPRTLCSWPSCTQTFARATDLDRHWDSVHLGIKYHCFSPGCHNNRGKGYCRFEKLKTHQREKHGFV